MQPLNNNLESQAQFLVRDRYFGDAGLLDTAIKTLLHDEIFSALQETGLLSKLVFQGGTALQRCYGGQRLSEDLDFVCGHSPNLLISSQELSQMGKDLSPVLTRGLSKRYNINPEAVSIKSPKNPHLLTAPAVTSQTWQIRLELTPRVKKQMVKIELANVPSYENTAQLLHPSLNRPDAPMLPVFIRAESKEEILADKIVALCSRNYVKYRDIWDYYFLIQGKTQLNKDLVIKKFHDYRVEELQSKIEMKISLLQESKKREKEFQAEMRRFLPASSLKQMQKLGLVKNIFDQVVEVLQGFS